MSKSRSKPEFETKRSRVDREYLGLDCDRALINAERFRDVMPRLDGGDKPYEIGKEDPPEGHVDASPHGRSIIGRGQVLKPVEIDEHGNVLDGFDRWDISQRHGFSCPLVRVTGLEGDRQKRDYIREVNAARRNLDARFREGLAHRYLEEEEAAYKAGEIKYRSLHNRVGVICGLSLRKVRQIERAHFPDRWSCACAGETRISLNDRTFEVRETDPASQIKGLLAKLAEETPVDQQEAAIRALRETLDKHGDVLGGKDRKELKDQVDEADQRLRRRKASGEKSTSSDPATTKGGPPSPPGRGDKPGKSVAEILAEVESEPEIEDLDRRPFTAAVALYMDQRLLARDGLTVDGEWQSRVVRVAERCKVSVDDALRLLHRRPSNLDQALMVLDRLFLASGMDPSELRDSLSKSLLMALFAKVA